MFLAFGAVPAAAQQPAPRESPAYDRAIAAGYKALTLCSAMFNGAGRTQAQVETLELTGIYPEYDAIVPTLRANVDARRGMVSVPYDPAMPPRTATVSGRNGCTIQPIGWAPLEGVNYAAATPRPRQPLPWPMGDVNALAAPSAAAPALARTVAAAFDGATFGADGRTTAVVIVRNSRILGERYADGFGIHTAQRTWSVAKSLAGTIIGAAAQRGLIDPAAPPPLWSVMGDPRLAITTDQLLRMASGLHSATAGNRTDAIYFGGASVSEETMAWPLEALPGTRFRYANNDILLAMSGLQNRIGVNGGGMTFPDDLLFRRIGMRDTVAETDWQGHFILSSQVWSTARDLARFGMLYLNDGVWNGERILPANWRAYVSRPSGPQPQGAFGYGATFWLMNNSPGVPADTFAAFGNRGQYVVIVPSRNLVIVRRGEDAAGTRFDIARFTADVIGALE